MVFFVFDKINIILLYKFDLKNLIFLFFEEILDFVPMDLDSFDS